IMSNLNSPIQRSSEFPTSHASTAPRGIDSQALYEKEQNLLRWDEELRARERNLNVQSQGTGFNNSASAAAPATGRGFMPSVNISEDIPIANQKLAKFAMGVFGWTCLSLVWNFVCGIAAIIYSQVADFFLSLFYLLVGVPIAYFLTRRLYRAARNGKPKANYAFIMGYVGLFLFSLFFALGFKYSGMHGLIWMISLFHNHHKAVGALNVVSLFFWVVNSILIAGVLFKVLRMTNIQRNRGETANFGLRDYIRSR
ncbi:hypothetical protein SAMD00019534_102630, partial [Acytostelium subglobosum LB1]|uniref:hypothetical protein n=1 Tax=Acytostelium subglobosum LB1 TaxID=1410327 RepID=UPI000644AE75